jgi:3D (Asp-Asp-Asp) domain-containing protein
MMLRVVSLAALAGAALFLVGCAERQLPAYEPPLKRSQFMKVRTTAYTHTESDHLAYANFSAIGSPLLVGAPQDPAAALVPALVRSAAADWSRWPAGTQFVVLATGQVYQVDDYGWALAGRNTIDLYCPTRAEMNDWGVRRVTIQILRWGDPWKSYHVLKPRQSYAHVRRMLTEIKNFY